MKYITYGELNTIINSIEDYRDKVLIMLMFDGFYKCLEEIQNFTYEGVIDNPTHQSYLYGRKITGATLRVIKRAMREEEVHTYSKFNSGIDILIPSNYILREREGYSKRKDVEIGKNFNGYSMNKTSIINRFMKIKKIYNLEFTMSSLYASGCIYRAKNAVKHNTDNFKRDFISNILEENVSTTMAYNYYKIFLEMGDRG